jgi:hypothetical protein
MGNIMKLTLFSFCFILGAFSISCEKNKGSSNYSIPGEIPHPKPVQQAHNSAPVDSEGKGEFNTEAYHLGVNPNSAAHSDTAVDHQNPTNDQYGEVASRRETSPDGESNLASAPRVESPLENSNVPAFLARKCGSENEGEMGFNAKERKAYFCDGSAWVVAPGQHTNVKQALSKLDMKHVKDDSFLCLKSKEGAYRCMKGESFRMAH